MLHGQVVQAISTQLATLNTNVRYLHSSVVEFAEQISALMPPPLQVCAEPQHARITIAYSDTAC